MILLPIALNLAMIDITIKIAAGRKLFTLYLLLALSHVMV